MNKIKIKKILILSSIFFYFYSLIIFALISSNYSSFKSIDINYFKYLFFDFIPYVFIGTIFLLISKNI